MPQEELDIPEKRQAFLALFTLQLILNSSNKVAELGKIVKKETEKELQPPKTSEEKPKEKETKKTITKKKKNTNGMIKSILSQAPPPQRQKEEIRKVNPVNVKVSRMEVSGKLHPPVLRMPEPRLPPEFRYLRPTPTSKEIDLEKLNPLIYDPAVRTIECPGPDKPIVVTGAMGKKPTEISLSNDEVEDIIKRFSTASKIPADTGAYKVVVGRLIFSAVISDVVPSRFMIRKMILANPPTPVFMNRNPNYKLFFRK